MATSLCPCGSGKFWGHCGQSAACRAPAESNRTRAERQRQREALLRERRRS